MRRILDRAGFAKIELDAIDLEIDIAAGQGLEVGCGDGAVDRRGEPRASRADPSMSAPPP